MHGKSGDTVNRGTTVLGSGFILFYFDCIIEPIKINFIFIENFLFIEQNVWVTMREYLMSSYSLQRRIGYCHWLLGCWMNKNSLSFINSA